ncbi:MAG: YbaB/EbfC family nucleoid-associated protein [Nitrospinota bacterium]
MRGFGNLMKQARQVQERLQQIQSEMAQRTVEASAGGGMVKAVATGNGDLLSVKIEREVVNPEDVEMLEDLVVAAANEAIRKGRELMKEEMTKLTGGISIPGLF